MSNTPKHKFNSTEFKTFMLLYAAHADLEFTQDERNYILTKIDREGLAKVESIFDELSDYERLQTLIDYKGLYYPTPARKQELLDNMEELFGKDGDYSSLEKNLLLFLTKLL